VKKSIQAMPERVLQGMKEDDASAIADRPGKDGRGEMRAAESVRERKR